MQTVESLHFWNGLWRETNVMIFTWFLLNASNISVWLCKNLTKIFLPSKTIYILSESDTHNISVQLKFMGCLCDVACNLNRSAALGFSLSISRPWTWHWRASKLPSAVELQLNVKFMSIIQTLKSLHVAQKSFWATNVHHTMPKVLLNDDQKKADINNLVFELNLIVLLI